MAKLQNDNVVVTPKQSSADNSSFDTLRKTANAQSPVSQRNPATVAKGK